MIIFLFLAIDVDTGLLCQARDPQGWHGTRSTKGVTGSGKWNYYMQTCTHACTHTRTHTHTMHTCKHVYATHACTPPHTQTHPHILTFKVYEGDVFFSLEENLQVN